MTSPSLTTAAAGAAYHQSYAAASTAYGLGPGNPYLQPYAAHPYSMRLHPGIDYSREASWSYYDTAAEQQPAGSTSSSANSNSSQPQGLLASSKSSSKRATPPKRSPQSSSPETPLATPVAVRATVTATPATAGSKTTLSPRADSEGSWKASPTQEVPEYPTTKVSLFAFDAAEAAREHHGIHDQHVPPSALDHHREASWYAHAFVRYVNRDLFI